VIGDILVGVNGEDVSRRSHDYILSAIHLAANPIR
jgi:hypothetical protein